MLDASALVDLVLGSRHRDWIAAEVERGSLVAPGHMQAEALNGLNRARRRGESPPGGFAGAVRLLQVLPLEVVPVSALLTGAWARRDQHSIHDALYVELAAQLETVVITTDRRLARATPLAVAPPE